MGERWLLRLLCYERGAVLWLPSLWLAMAAVLFGILQAPAERTFFNHTRDLKVALGPLDLEAAPAAAAQAFEAGLRAGLAAQRELTLVAAAPVRQRAEAVLGVPLPPDPRRWMRATRNLNVSYFVTAQLRNEGDGWQASAEVWQVAEETRLRTFTAHAHTAETLGRGLADSVGAALFTPRADPLARR